MLFLKTVNFFCLIMKCTHLSLIREQVLQDAIIILFLYMRGFLP